MTSIFQSRIFLRRRIGFSLLVTVLLLHSGYCQEFGGSQEFTRKVNQNQSLTINLYYETLCPDCVEFIAQKLCPLWEEDMSKYFTIEFVPYGNAETTVSETGEISIDCQHGPPECAANMIHACALKHLSYKLSTNFICCMEKNHNVPGSGPGCAEDYEIDYSIIDACAKGKEGIELHYKYGQATEKLVPSHEYVPWILFNRHYDQADMDHAQSDLLGVVCKYLGEPKPEECNELY